MMTKVNFRKCFLLLGLCMAQLISVSNLHAQPAGTTNFYTGIKNYNLSSLWRAGQLRLLSLKETEPFPEPYGVLGKNNRRFYIHYTAVVKDSTNPYRYQVQGKTRVGKVVRPFTGTLVVTQAGIYKPGSVYAPDSYKGYKRGVLSCKVVISETSAGGGKINGELVTYFCINSQNQLLYDTLDFGIDGYQNNQFTGTLKAANNPAAQKLMWGDYNLNNSPFADPGGITVPPEFEKYGWQTYVDAQGSDLKPASKAAKAEEKRQWWK